MAHGQVSRRNRVPGGTFFFTVTLADRRSRALVEHVGALRSAFRATRQERPFIIEAVVILPDHLHAIFTLPPGDADFSGRWRRIKGLFTRKVGATEGRLWQRRFWEHTIRDDKDFVRHVDYIHWNPVKHGHVSRVGEWPYSSFHRYVRMGWLVEDWRGDVSDPGGAFGEPGG